MVLGDGSSYLDISEITGSSLKTLTISGADTSTASYTIPSATIDLSSINLSGMSGLTQIYYGCGCDPVFPTNDINILVGNGDLFHESRDRNNDTSGWDTFHFTGSDISTVTIENFRSTDAANTDILDFSMFDGVNSLADLCVSLTDFDEDPGTPSDTVITSAGFNGNIVLSGVDLTDPLISYYLVF